jgi:hypothetical protein
MQLKFALDNAVIPALKMLPLPMDSPRARVLLLAIGLQESEFTARVQHGGGPARGFWQFEENGGVRGVWRHSASTEQARLICRARDCGFEPRAIWMQLATDDILAAAFARLLLFTDPKPLPELGDAQGGWLYYERNWRPGKPHPEKWPENYARAMSLITSTGD